MGLKVEGDLLNLTGDSDFSEVYRVDKRVEYIEHLYDLLFSKRWTEKEIDMSLDRDHFEKKLTEAEQHTTKYSLAYFARGDVVVIDNITANFLKYIKHQGIVGYFGEQNANEYVHARTYSMLLVSVISDPDELKRLFYEIDTLPSVKMKIDWVKKWQEKVTDLRQLFFVFLCVEGIHFSTSFTIMFWLKRKAGAIMPGTTYANDFIWRDEGVHVLALIWLINSFEPLPEEDVLEIIREAVEAEKMFVREAIPAPLTGLDAESVCDFVESNADFLLEKVGMSPIYHKKNPLDFMKLTGVNTDVNFFERKKTYQRNTGTISHAGDHPNAPAMDFQMFAKIK